MCIVSFYVEKYYILMMEKGGKSILELRVIIIKKLKYNGILCIDFFVPVILFVMFIFFAFA